MAAGIGDMGHCFCKYCVCKVLCCCRNMVRLVDLVKLAYYPPCDSTINCFVGCYTFGLVGWCFYNFGVIDGVHGVFDTSPIYCFRYP